MTSNCTLPRRLMAMLYDGLLLLALMFLGTLPFIAIRGGEPVDPGELSYQLVMLGIAWLFFCGFWTFAGRTLGMQSWGLRVETASGVRPSLARSTLRLALSVVSLLPFGLGFFWQLWDSNNLALHDRWSGTNLKFTPRG